MISIKSEKDIEKMLKACRIAAGALRAVGELVKPGVTTKELDTAARQYIESHGAKPAFLGYNGFSGSACISVNEEVIHGIPGKRKIKPGDIVSVDVGAYYLGFNGDCADTFTAEETSPEAQRLIEVTRRSFFEGLRFVREGMRISDISRAIQHCAEKEGFSLVRAYTGHGVGEKLHEPPEVPNFLSPGPDPRLMRGMTLAIEPMVNAGKSDIVILDDGWTVVTADRSLSAHYENTVLVTSGDPVLLTQL